MCSTNSYFDNISIVPAYKITYNLNGGSGSIADEYNFNASYTLNNGAGICKAGCIFKGWALTADSTEVLTGSVVMTPGEDLTLYAVWEDNPDDTIKTVELYDGDVLRAFYNVVSGKNRTLPDLEVQDGKVLYGWQTADGKVLHGYNIVTVTDHMKLYALWKPAEIKPGINVFSNGDFEATEIDVRPSHGYVSIVTDTDGNRVLEYVRGSGYASIQHYIPWENGRMYKVGYRFRANYKAGIASNARYYELSTAADGTTSTKYDHIFGQDVANADTWFTYSSTYTFSKDDYTPDNRDAISFYYNQNSEEKGGTVYYDDLVFIPYYKVTYHAEAAENLPASEYFLEGDYTVSSQVPTRDGYFFRGWSLTEGGVSKVTTVTPVPGEDVNLYAIWESVEAANAINYDYTSSVPGIANGTIAVICPDEVASHTNIEVYFADDNGILTDYTPFATMTITDGKATYAVTGNRGFAPGVTRLAFVFKAEGLDDITYWHTIPDEHRLDVENHALKFKFWATSDSHLGGSNYNSDYWPEMTVNRNNAMADIFASDADFMFINGDVVNYGPEKYGEVLRTYLDDRLNNKDYNKNLIPVFLTNGNHEYMNSDNANGGFDYDPIQSVLLEQLEYLKENYPDIKITHDGESIWYAADIEGAKFIFLSSPEEKAEGNSHTYTMGTAQLKFLDEQLYESEYSNKTAFVVTHVPLNKYVPSADGYQAGIANTAAIEEILAMHPNTIFCTGHSHSDIGDEDSHFVVVGDMTSKFTHLNDGCLVWIDPTDGVGENGTAYIKSYSTGMYIEVYNDMVVVRGRKFLSDSMYFGHAVYIIPTQDSEKSVAKASIEGTVKPGEVLTAVLDVENPDDYTYNWIVNGKLVSTEKSWTIDSNSDYAGNYVYLRAIDKNGYYASTKSASAFEGVTVTFDANGGSTSVPQARLVLKGYYSFDNSSVFPKKDGYFFIGWSTDKNASVPMAGCEITQDTTLYAVYTDEPKFYFDAHFSGFIPNGSTDTAAVTDGLLVTVTDGGDQHYNWSAGSFAAEDYPVLRIKLKYEGQLDGVFFKSDAGSFDETRHLMFHQATAAAEFDGYTVYEFHIPNIPEEGESWYGTISALRYDAVGLNGGTNITDYLVFTDKKGVFKADITVDAKTNTAVLSEDSKNCTVADLSRKGDVVTVTLTPDEGYEFTTVDDVLANVTIIGEAPISASVDKDGVATVTSIIPVTVEFGTVGEGALTASIALEDNISRDSVVLVAVCGEGGKFISCKMLDEYARYIDVYVDATLNAVTARAFVFESFDSLKPVCLCTDVTLN